MVNQWKFETSLNGYATVFCTKFPLLDHGKINSIFIVMLMILNYISQQDQMKLLNFLSKRSVLKM